MKLLHASFLAICILFVPSYSSAQWYGPAAPDSITFQGFLTDNVGAIVPDGNYNLVFAMYKNGTKVWEQTHAGVPVENGVFDVILSSSPSWPLDTVAFNVPIELGVKVNGGSELSPRTPMTSSSYALGLRGQHAVWSENGGDKSYNLIGGAPNSFIGASVIGGTIGGGGGWTDDSATPDSVTGSWGTVGGGASNTAGSRATVGGGTTNKATGLFSTIAGGTGNRASGQQGTVGGGSGNSASDLRATVGGGASNTADGESASIVGGSQNEATANYTTVGGGSLNEATAQYGTVGGGESNVAATNSWATIAGGRENESHGGGSTVGGGQFNAATGASSTVPGGLFNRAVGTASLAAGYKARANHEGTFVWNDRSVTTNDDSLLSTAANQFIIRAAGGVGIGTNSPQEQLHIDAGGPTGIFLGGAGSAGPHGIVFEDDSSPGNGIQIMYRAAPNQLVIEASSGGTGTNPVDAFFFDRDDFNFGFKGVVRPIDDDAYDLGTATRRWSQVYVESGVVNSSDARLKQDVAEIDSALDPVMALRPVRFRWRDEPHGDLSLGLIAQDTEMIVPEVVHPPETEDAYYGLNYAELVPLLIGAIQEQQEMILDLRDKNDRLGERLASVEATITN